MVLAGALVGSRAEDEPSPKEAKKMLKAVVHVNFADAERQKHGLKNVGNILKEVKGEAEVVVVCHGAGIDLLVKGKSQNADQVEQLVKAKVRFAACENTLREKAIPKADLLPGVTTTPSGAVEVVRKQQEGSATSSRKRNCPVSANAPSGAVLNGQRIILHRRSRSPTAR